MQYVCNVHCKCVVAHAYNMVAKAKALVVEHQDFGNYLRAAAVKVVPVVLPSSSK